MLEAAMEALNASLGGDCSLFRRVSGYRSSLWGFGSGSRLLAGKGEQLSVPGETSDFRLARSLDCAHLKKLMPSDIERIHISRYRVSPDCVPLSNGRKNSLRTCKEDDADNGGRIPNYSPFEGKPPRRSGSGSTVPQDHHSPHVPFPSDSSQSENQPPYAAADSTPPAAKAPSHHHEINGVSRGSGDVLLQWGHKKRSRGSRAESRPAAGNGSVHSRQMIKIQRRSAAAGAEKLAAAAAAAAAASAAMPPPCGSYTRGANLRPCLPSRDAMASSINRGVEERSGGLSRSEKRSPPSPAEKTQKGAPNGTAADANPADSKAPSDQEMGGSNVAATTGEKLNLENFEWPRIYISLSRKEKEDDFLAMKGTKLPQRPKKRAKNIDKTLQYCFPGMWLSDLTRGRYEVREKKCVKKENTGDPRKNSAEETFCAKNRITCNECLRF
uniref:Uncharacterized protein LOC105047334 isoform X6 n=1 Tax=Elaeis guineensis var. tenera TaxID=51953 RepID=A0A8N4IEA0_ELAGV|nr:uncharacterized protein LOC105047334 isoform X6 [Elaeis guineensis]